MIIPQPAIIEKHISFVIQKYRSRFQQFSSRWNVVNRKEIKRKLLSKENYLIKISRTLILVLLN